MKLRKMKLFMFIIIPIIILYLLFCFISLSMNISEFNRGLFIFILICIWMLQALILFFHERGNDTYFEECFLYSEKEEIEKKIENLRIKNEQIRELNKLSNRQLEIIKENKEIKDKLFKYY